LSTITPTRKLAALAEWFGVRSAWHGPGDLCPIGHAASLHLEACVDTVRVLADGGAPLVIGGLPGRVLAELVALAGPVAWHVVAAEVWRENDHARLRRRWDVTLTRLRERLRALGLRDDLVHTDGAGHVELLLRPGDTTEVVDG